MAVLPQQRNFHLSRWTLMAAALIAVCRPVGVHATLAIDSASFPILESLRKPNSFASKICRPSGPGLMGNLLDDAGCRLDKKSAAHHSALLNDTIEPIRQWSLRVLKSTRRVNSAPTMARSADAQFECGPGCQKTPPCCEVDVKLTFPLYGRSLSSNSIVEIVQGLGDIRQPIIYHECRTTEANLVRGRCVQTSLPRLMYVRAADGRGARRGYNYHQDLVLVPSSCDCIVSLQTAAAKSPLDNTDSNSVPLFVNLPFAPATTDATQPTTPATRATLPTQSASTASTTTSTTVSPTSNEMPTTTKVTESGVSDTTKQVQPANSSTASSILKKPLLILRPNFANKKNVSSSAKAGMQEDAKKPPIIKVVTSPTPSENSSPKRDVRFNMGDFL